MFESQIYNQQRQNVMDFNQKVNRGDFSPNAMYRQPDQAYGSPNHINNDIGRIDYTKPLYRAESNFDIRTPLQKCEVNPIEPTNPYKSYMDSYIDKCVSPIKSNGMKLNDSYMYKAPSIENDLINPIFKKKDPFPYMKDYLKY